MDCNAPFKNQQLRIKYMLKSHYNQMRFTSYYQKGIRTNQNPQNLFIP